MTHHRFTAIEILIIVGTIAALGAGVVVLMNPTKQFAQARNAHRQANVSALVQAIEQRLRDNAGAWNIRCGSLDVILPDSTTIIGSDSGNINLAPCLVPTYIASMVADPSVGSDASTGYLLTRDRHGRITVTAPYAELGAVISATQ